MRLPFKLCLFLLITLFGCSVIEIRDFDQRDSTEEEFYKEGAQCQMEAKKYEAQAGMGFWSVHGNYDDMLETCMRSKGFPLKR